MINIMDVFLILGLFFTHISFNGGGKKGEEKT